MHVTRRRCSRCCPAARRVPCWSPRAERCPSWSGAGSSTLTCCRAARRALFGVVAGEERAAAEPDATEAVLKACAGLPLAIRIAGARLVTRSSWNVRTLSGRLADERHRLDELRVGNLAVRASFEVSFASLPAAARGGPDP